MSGFIQSGRFGVASSFAPTDIAGLALWLDAGNYSGSGTEWPDAGPNNLDGTLFNSPTWGTHAGGRRMFSFNGTTQYASVADNALLDFGTADSFSLVVVCQQASYASADWIAGKKNDSSASYGYGLRNGAGTPANVVGMVGDNTNIVSINSGSRTNGALYLLAVTRSVSLDQVGQYVDNTASTPLTDTTVGTLANALPLTIARNGAGAEFCAIDVLAVLVYSVALTAGNISDLCTYYGTV